MEAGRVVISIRVAGGRFADIAVSVARPTGLAGRLVGQPGATALATIGLLFPLCGAAHRAALAAALGATPVPAPQLAAERLVARAWRLALDAPALLGLPENPQGLVAVRKAVAAGALVAAGNALHALAEGFDDPDAPFGAFEQRARQGTGPVARLMADALDRGLGFGVAAGTSLATPDAGFYDAALAQPGFGERPTLPGGPAEIGPLAVVRDAPLPEAIIDRFGPGHLARLVAGLLPDAAPDRPAHRHGATGLALTARGPLAYRATAAGGLLASVTSAAPTEWHFHPQGPFAQALAAAEPGADPAATLRRLAFGFDPCVPLAVTLAPLAQREAAHA